MDIDNVLFVAIAWIVISMVVLTMVFPKARNVTPLAWYIAGSMPTLIGSFLGLRALTKCIPWLWSVRPLRRVWEPLPDLRHEYKEDSE